MRGRRAAAKSQLAAALLAAGEIEVLADVTALWVALSGAVRGPDGLYPERLDDDPALAVAQYVQAVAARQALDEGADVGVTTSRAGQVDRWREVADNAATPFLLRTVDPGIAVVSSRLAGVDGVLSAACRRAIARFYG